MELRILMKRNKKRVPNRAPDGQILYGGGSHEVTSFEEILQYRVTGSEWLNVPRVRESEPKDGGRG